MTLFFTGIPLVLFDDCIQFTFDLMQKSADMHQNDNSVIIYIYCTMMLHIQHPASNIHHTNVSVTQFNSRWYLCAALHPICQKFPHCWMVSVRCTPPHLSEVSPLLDGICALRSTPSVRSFPIVAFETILMFVSLMMAPDILSRKII